MNKLVLVPTQLERLRLPSAASAVICGLGPVAAALGAAEALTEHAPREVLLVGLAGSRHLERAPLGSLALGSEAWNECVGVGHGREFLDLQDMALPGEMLPADVLALHHPVCLAELVGLPLGTVATASANSTDAEARRARRPQVVLEEMEAWGVAQACARRGVKLAVLRAVSNAAGDRDHSGWHLREAFELLDQALQCWLAAEPEA